MFNAVQGNRRDKFIGNYLRMQLFVILTGYLLVVTKLFELIGIAVVVSLWIMFHNSRRLTGVQANAYVVAGVFDLLEFPQTILKQCQNVVQSSRARLVGGVRRLQSIRLNRQFVMQGIVAVVMAISIAMRLYVAVTNPTPKMSDGDYLLAWIKYIDLRYLMHDGVYPQGYFFYMAVLGKFAVINPLYILNFTGPLDSVMIILMMYYAVKTWTRSLIGGLVAIMLYGVLGQHLLLGEWTRQAGSETQEFGLMLVFPTMMFLHRYLEDQRRTNFWVAFAGLTDAGLIHPVSYVLSLMGCCAMLLAHLVVRPREVWSRVPLLLGSGIVSGLVALLPYGLALFYRIGAAQMNNAFLTDKVTIPRTLTSKYSYAKGGLNTHFPAHGYAHSASSAWHIFVALLPPLSVWDWLAVASVVYLSIYSLVAVIRNRPNTIALAIALWGLVCFLLYEFGVAVTRSYLLSTRTIDIWAITQAAVTGFAVALLLGHLRLLKTKKWMEIVVAIVFVGVSVVAEPPKPIVPYDVQWSSDVNAYLEIDKQYRDLGYMIVAPNFEYALVLGEGYHMLVRQFVQEFNPTSASLTIRGQHHVDQNLAPYVFVYYYKRIFTVPQSMGIYSTYLQEYESEWLANRRLLKWLRAFYAAHPGNLSIFYDDPNLIVYEIKVDLKANAR